MMPTLSTEFQFTPLREGRHLRLRQYRAENHFNSRPSARGDWKGARRRGERRMISIHAPPRGATRGTYRHSFPAHFNSRPSARGDERGHPPAEEAQHFNSRPSARGDAAERLPTYRSEVLQFTPLRAGRPQADCIRQNLANFNSRPSARGDVAVIDAPDTLPISIHAPPRGATK